MGKVKLTRSRAYSSSGWGSWQSCPRTGIDYCYHTAQVVVYEAEVIYASGDTLTDVSVFTNFALYQYSLYGQDNHDTSISCYLYTSNPTGGSSTHPSNYIGECSYEDINLGYWGEYLEFSFSGLSRTSGAKLYFWFVDNASYVENLITYKDAVYHYKTGNEYTDTPKTSGTFYNPDPDPPEPETTEWTLILRCGTGVESVSGGGTAETFETIEGTAELKDGYRFKGWYDEAGTLISTSISYNFIAFEEGTYTYTAVAEKYDYMIIAYYGDNVKNTTGSGRYIRGETVSLFAEFDEPTDPEDEYVIDNWRKTNSTEILSTDNPYVFTATSNLYVIASGKLVKRGAVHINNGTNFVKALPYIWHKKEWRITDPYVYHNGVWTKCIKRDRPQSPLFTTSAPSGTYFYQEYYDETAYELHWELFFPMSGNTLTFTRLPGGKVDICSVGGGAPGHYDKTVDGVKYGGDGGVGATPANYYGVTPVLNRQYTIYLAGTTQTGTPSNTYWQYGLTPTIECIGYGADTTLSGGTGEIIYSSTNKVAATKGNDGVKAFDGEGLTILTDYDWKFGACGGGGAYRNSAGATYDGNGAKGGDYGGGNGAGCESTTAGAVSATAHTGSGGGGGGQYSTQIASGASGIFIIRDHR